MFDRIMATTLRGSLPAALFLLGLFAGVMALTFTPREEEPQIVVPMIDVLVSAPGLSARQTERQVTIPLEKLLAQIPGVEHLYSSTDAGKTAVTLRFFVGEDREDSLLNSYNKLYANQDQIPAVVTEWLLKPVEVDDVPILVLGLWSEDEALYSDFELRRMADEISTAIQAIPQTSEVNVIGGRLRTLRILLDPESLAARHTTAADIVSALQISNVLQQAGTWTIGNTAIALEAGDVLRAPSELAQMVVNVIDGAPVYLQDVATIIDGPAEPDSYTWLDFSGLDSDNNQYPMVAISVAKQRGANAVTLANDTLDLIEELREDLLPREVDVAVLRDYGETADAKVNNLASSLGFAIVTVVVFIALFLGWRPALIVGLAVPVCYGITLALDMLMGYTINRVTLFALILSLGLLVDDPITGVDNIARYMKRQQMSLTERVVAAMHEIRTPLILSTLTIVLAFLPLAAITGMMGPYMAPMAFNVPVSVISSTLVAFLVTPWLASWLLKEPVNEPSGAPDKVTAYARLVSPFLDTRAHAHRLLWVVGFLFVFAALLPALRWVPLKLLPFDSKNEVQVLIDMPESASLERTAAHTRRVADEVLRLPEVDLVAAFIGEPSPIDFNGMVRRYYQRRGPHLAELRLVLKEKLDRKHQSHAVVLRLRELLGPLQTAGVNIKVVEVPPGPPVLSTLVGEIYGESLTPYASQQEAATVLMERLSREAHVVEIDASLEGPQARLRFTTDQKKAALSGVSTSDIAQTLTMANDGYVAGYLQQPQELKPLPIELRLAQEQRASRVDLERLQVRGRAGVVKTQSPQGLDLAPQPLVAMGELGEFVSGHADTPIFRKNLRPVVYVTAELNGRTPGAVIADLVADYQEPRSAAVRPWQSRTFFTNGGGDGWALPEGTSVVWAGEGELQITLDVFRDMGLGYLFALLAIFVVLRIQTSSTALSLIIMLAIPLTIIGIMPGFWLMNHLGERVIAGAPEPVLFTATAMIGMIALAGIVVRNSLILVEFITQARNEGMPIREALLQAGSVRMRPVLLTAGTTMLGNLVITLDPVFNGLALAIIFGIVASTLFTLIVVPVVYLLVFEGTETAVTADPREDSP
ncbi:efflux RND transporter permease subunit [Congregibacter litoralis]|uniref:Cation/multidrug efflux pump n=1 Tax=Congregibacter litoralis KT71 TaxID=314285 RepID=A4A4Y3_9GAMM|nr:efflux RND transporter permease subunit [Congregibacter litoralis]EAQ98854.1 Cation/multidrug efflux pump [Congregibacter litoralis KT71]